LLIIIKPGLEEIWEEKKPHDEEKDKYLDQDNQP
jgi:hypothetical protein